VARTLIRAGGALALLGLGAVLGALVWLTRDLPPLDPLLDYRPALPSVVVERAGLPVAEFYVERRRLTPLADVPPHVIEAFLASEDAAFFRHRGVDALALARASIANLRAGGAVRQGGSTITQQLAKNLLLTPERTLVRKLRDIALAVRIERALPKERILEIYLNDVYLGRGAYGVGQAARAYFGKGVAALTVSEAALLAGLVAAPTRYSPARNPEAAEVRRRWVLERMGAVGHLTPEEVAAAIAAPPAVIARVPPAIEPVAADFVEEVRRELFAQLGEEAVRRGGLRIETTLDLELQRRAVHALRRGLEAVDGGGWDGPAARAEGEQELADALADLRFENSLVAERRGPIALPEARTLRGVVLGVAEDGAPARIGLAPGVEAALHWEDAAWAARRGAKRGARSLGELLAPGDVAHFEAVPGQPGRVRLVQPPAVQGALAAVEVETGDVLALVGGYDFREGQFNRATQARRQPGSAFKPFVYGAALEAGFPTDGTVYDYQVESCSERLRRWWRPRNAGGVLRGPVPIFEAFARSLNNATIRLLDDVGTERVADFARRAGIASPLAEDRSLALGTSEVTPLELTAAYATFARGGERRAPRLVRQVLDRDGRELEQALPADEPAPAPAPDAAGIAPVDAYLLTHLMRGVVRRPYGTAHAAARIDAPLVGKTGSTNRNRDAWFVGYSPRVAAGVWVGHDAPTRELARSQTGGRVALPIWIEFMDAAVPRFPDQDGFDIPEGVHFAWTDAETQTAQRSRRFVAWGEPVATGRPARRATYVAPPAPPPEPEPAFAPAAAPGPTLGSFREIGAPAPAAPLIE
jgi:penicillin-binding protein 1A